VSRSRILSPAFALFFVATAGWASSLANIGPLAELDEVSIQGVMVGDSLTLGDVPLLFQGQPAAAKAFESELVSQVTAHLRQAGLRVNSASSAQVGFRLFGGKLGGCDTTNVFMLEVWVSPQDATTQEVQRTVLGTAGDAELASTVIRAALSLIDGFTDERTRFRQERHSQGAP
jgi:hypothetical protein